MAKDDKKKAQLLAQQQAEDRARYLQLAEKAQEPSELQKRYEGDQLDFLNWEDSAGKYAGQPLDVTKAPGMGPALSLYARAKTQQLGSRQGQGLITMGTNASDPGMALRLKEESDLRRDQDAAGALEGAVAQRSAEAHGSVMPLSQLDTSRALSLAGEAGNQSRFSTGTYANWRPEPGFFGNLKNSLGASLGQTLGTFGRGSQGGWSMGQGFFRDGGDTGPYMGEWGVAGEDGPEMAVDRMGRRRLLGANGPVRFYVDRPETIIPAPESRALALAEQASGDSPPPNRLFAMGQSAGLTPQTGAAAPAVDAALTRPRRATQPSPVSKLLALASDAESPVEAGDAPLALPPSPQPTAPLVRRPPSEFQPSVVPMTGNLKTRNIPFPGEEEANDANVRGVIERGGGFAPLGDVHTRPRVADPLGLADRRVEEDALLSRPTDRNGRGRSVWTGLKRGFIEGGPVGAIVGAATHALDPSLDEQDDQRRMVGRDVAVADTLTRRRAANLGLQGAAADVENKRAQAYRARNPERKPLQHVTVDSRAYTFDPNDGTYTDAKLPGGAKLKPGTDELGLFLYDPDHPDVPVVRPKGEELKQFVDYQPIPEGVTYHVPATTAAQGDATIAASNASATNEGRRQAAREQNEKNRVKFENDSAAYAAVEKAVNEHNAKQAAYSKAYANALATEQDKTASAEDKAYQQSEALRLKGELDESRSAIGETDYAYMGADGRYHMNLRAKPTKPNAVSTPAPMTRAPAGKASSPKPITANSTEAEVRAEAQRRGKDENAAVEKWKKMRGR